MKNVNCCNPITDTSVLIDVKKYLGPSINYTVFDMDIIMNINAAFFVLFELGVGPTDEAFTISGNSELWSEFSESKTIISATKQYIFLKVKNTFDPPTSSYVLQAYESQIQELEWRLRELASGMLDPDEEDKGDDCCCCHHHHHCKPNRPSKPTEPGDEDPNDPDNPEDPNNPDDEEPTPSKPYVLPIATADTLGGVMIGDNVNVDEEGRISVKPEGVNVATKEEVDEILDSIFERED